MRSYLPNEAFFGLENKRKVVENLIFFKMGFGWGKLMKHVKVMPGQSSIDFS